ncbi:acyltransferase family protein [Acerihabitans arboris]|uniref:Acyltransferase family protein n=1 Tax=Acerihabitans arboris TaxID=2691583 RepID=A0A845SF28_9GAMM|nr:acyltransferase family protein [Acerihabitans arboris]NDL62479.1 acyltransferase family protein [Acerihabitans arboris]
MPATEKKIQWINSLKGICILLVVLNHIITTSYIPSLEVIDAHMLITKLWVGVNHYLVPLRMPAFFFISGLLAADGVINRSWREVMTKKPLNLLYLYLLWCAVQWLCVSMINRELAFDDWRLMARNAAYAASTGQFLLYVAAAMSSPWYLYALALYFVACKLWRRHWAALLGAGALLNYACVLGAVPWWGPASVAQNGIFFFTGCFLGARIVALLAANRSRLALLAALGIMALIHWGFAMDRSLFTSALAVCVAILCCQWVNRHWSLYNQSLHTLNWIGKNTLQIYVLHKLLTELLAVPMLGALMRYHAFDHHLFSLLWMTFYPLAATALCTAGAIAIWWALNRGVGRVLFQYPSLARPQKALG